MDVLTNRLEAIAAIVVGLPAVLLTGFWIMRKAKETADEVAHRTRVAHSLARSRVHWGRTGRALWAELYERVPGMREEAARHLLGNEAYDLVMGPPPAVAGAAAVAACETAPEPVASASTEETPKEPSAVYFKDGEPRTLQEYHGQPHVTEYLQALIDGLPDTAPLPTEHQLLNGPPGLGKTLLLRTYANTVNERNARLGLPAVRFQEEFPADLGTLQALDEAVRRAADMPTMLFIDEIHDLTDRHALKLYMLMEDGRYKFENEPEPVSIPNLCVLGATTDYGAMHAALKRRFNRHMLEPMSAAQIVAVVEQRPFPIEHDAAVALTERTHFSGAPWEALQLYGQARAFAKQAKRDRVTRADVERVFASQKIDALGLRWMDRRVIEVLLTQPRYRRPRGKDEAPEFVCFGASESDVCAMAQIDRGEYRESIKPRLLARQLLHVRPTYGQALRERAIEVYGSLRAA